MATATNTPAVLGERLGIFVDVRGLYYSTMKIFGENSKINYRELLAFIKKDRACAASIAYIITKENINQGSFYGMLKHAGYVPKVKEQRKSANSDEMKPIFWHVGMTIDIMEMVFRGQIDTVCLVTSDGIMTDLVKSICQRNIKCEVYWFEGQCSKALQNSCNEFVALNKKVVITDSKKPKEEAVKDEMTDEIEKAAADLDKDIGSDEEQIEIGNIGDK